MAGLDGLTAIVTGAGRGIGREHALLLARQGASVVVNDLGGAQNGTGNAAGPAESVVAEIRAEGLRAVANTDDISDPAGAQRLVDTALDEFDRLDILINNAGVLRDRVLVNLDDDDWDLVVRVNLRGTFLLTRAAGTYWRARSKAGEKVNAAVVNTTSESGLFGNPGQANYAAAKAGVASLTQVASKELARYGVRVNAVAPQARTRLTESFGAALAAKEGAFDRWHPGNISPFVAYLVSPDCEMSGEVFVVGGSKVQRVAPWQADKSWTLSTDGRWTHEKLVDVVAEIGLPLTEKWSANPEGLAS
ncbi:MULTISPECIES: SDR family NAD(P)-dependent oxidoreductase [unclassified Pseudofrankia]|uniref:SDR family NAD(P)-dependent oxidoreductase n=1 Tax=unclassified Pseudofrankia TaxID=2994372 RepID=UPI0008DA67FF|nr:MULTISPECIES: SDR family NAD(P)-dependent oxidoreductase [unclassified Pseudofrankia]MDT3445619.1 SDR family NAD(P)-dependent oxidoreductase [Pseudofrankia sp. BMG5.37]OHV63532.1 short-chain dehydrogenase [Pseudofrankia sp. BMG5.36]